MVHGTLPLAKFVGLYDYDDKLSAVLRDIAKLFSILFYIFLVAGIYITVSRVTNANGSCNSLYTRCNTLIE